MQQPRQRFGFPSYPTPSSLESGSQSSMGIPWVVRVLSVNLD